MKIIRPFSVNDAALVSSNVAETDYAAWSAGTTYALGDRRIYVVANTHWIIESLQNGNIGHTPTGLATDTWWLKVGQTNRWDMFDTSVQSQTTNADAIDVSLLVNERINAAVLLNVNAASVQITMTDTIDGVVYDQTYSLVSYSGITDWYAYFFEPIVRLQDVAITDMPSYVGATVDVLITDTGNTVACGGLILGLQREIGKSQYGLNTGITDYSVKQQDDFGNYTILERSFRKRAEISVWVDNGLIDQLQIMLASLRAVPSIYIGSDSYANTIIYGFYKDFNINIAYPTNSICTLTLEGIT